MRKKPATLILIAAMLSCAGTEQGSDDLLDVSGPYLGQVPPGDEPALFAPGIVSTGLLERDVAITPEGDELYFTAALTGYTVSTIAYVKMEDGRWTKPEIAPFVAGPEFMYIEPCISPDGQKLYFASNWPGPTGGESFGQEDIWVVDRTGDGWGEPYNPGQPVNSEFGDFFPSVTKDGTIYFTRGDPEAGTNFIYRCRYSDGAYQPAEKLPEQVNSMPAQFNAFIAPDESYIILSVAGRGDSFGGTDYYICFRSEDDVWSEPQNLGDTINTAGTMEHSSYVSPDGMYFFFMRTLIDTKARLAEDEFTYSALQDAYRGPQSGNSDIYWVSASFVETLRERAVFR